MGKRNMPEDISFGEWLRHRRHILDLTQQELVDQVGSALPEDEAMRSNHLISR
jgi:hypothetical protein